MYSLQKYGGPSTRFTCPRCGRGHCFTRYVDEEGNYLDESVGKCDHDSSCQYHYTPKQFFADHPDRKPERDWRYAPIPTPPAPKAKKLCFLPDHIVVRSIRYDYDSYLVTFLKTILDPVVLEGLITDYRIGVTKSRATIFFQIDVEGRCRTGKVMLYHPDTGHRIKDENTPGRITWVHSMMKKAGMLPADWELSQCLFGEHLLRQHPDMPVALVESEKTAVICAGLMPRYLWVATGGKSCLNDRLNVLKGRKVVAFPDVDGFQEWSDKLSKLDGLDITVSPVLQQIATPEDLEAHIDIADWLIRYRSGVPGPVRESHSKAFLIAARYLDPDNYREVEELIDDLGLVFMGAEKVEEPEDEKPP